jgi:thiosulfate dehydrogenase
MISPFSQLSQIIRVALVATVITLIFLMSALFLFIHPEIVKEKKSTQAKEDSSQKLWHAPDSLSIPADELGNQIRYGKQLIAHTALYLGPKGSVLQISNGMNCQNCHLNAGTKPFGNNYGSVASMYPRFRARSGGLESIEKRVNDCLERSLNGKKLDSLSHEMRAMVAYLNWVGKDVPKGKKAGGSGFYELAYLNRAADTVTGKSLYSTKCASCHGYKGEGLKRNNGIDFIYPPVGGENSFNVSAGLFRISNFTRYIYANMPLGATYDKPLLTKEESWDIASFVLTLPRPQKRFTGDWPKIETKPIDHPFGPYADSFSEDQHKFGPFNPILESLK